MKHAIYETLHLLKENLLRYLLADSFPQTPEVVILENLALLNENSGTGGIVLNLLKIEEENAAKDYPSYVKKGKDIFYKNPPINLNLYVLFCAKYPETKYEDGLKQLSNVIQYFNGKRYFTQQDTPDKNFEFKISIKLYSPSFEEINYIWSPLGGKHYPFVLYKVHIITMESDQVLEKGRPISGVEIIKSES